MKTKTTNYVVMLVIQIAMMFLAAFMEDSILIYLVFCVALLVLFGSVILSIHKHRALRILAIVSGVVGVIASLIWIEPHLSVEHQYLGFTIATFSISFFLLIAILSMIKNVFINDRVTTDRIIGSICLYFLFGMFFAYIYAGIGILNPNAFNLGGKTYGAIEDFKDQLYFSYSTLATIGYGDMIPTSSLTKMLAVLEGMLGSIYLVVMIARLVGIHVSEHVRKHLAKS